MKYVIVLILWANCNRTNHVLPAKNITEESASATNINTKSYNEIKNKAVALLEVFRKNPIARNEKDLYAFVADSLIQFWYGTTWNFYGTTETPGKGSIACGYFVTTVLRDAGMKINRSKLAQCASEVMIKQLSADRTIQRFSYEPVDSFTYKVLRNEAGLYIVGLDCHTGFLYNNKKEVYFIHASYRIPKIVIKEKAKESKILMASKYRVIGKINFFSTSSAKPTPLHILH